VAEATGTAGRREEILTAAIDLFDEGGFHATGVTDIGRAVGVTGPALYKYFANKGEILGAAMAVVAARLTEGMREAADATPVEGLELLIRGHVTVAVDDAAMIKVWLREERHLPDREWARAVQREYVEAWVRALSRLRPELPYGQARTLVHATISLIHSAAFYPRVLEPDELRASLFDLAWRVCSEAFPTA
jgi:AcrR family transcriptional regulator